MTLLTDGSHRKKLSIRVASGASEHTERVLPAILGINEVNGVRDDMPVTLTLNGPGRGLAVFPFLPE
jgi:hypothetical protein